MTKKNLYLAGVLIVLIAAAYIYNGPWQKWQENRGKVKNFLSELNIASIDSIEIAENGKTTVLEKTEDKWKIGGTKDFYAKESLASALISGLESAQTAEIELASQNSGKKSEFEVDAETGALVKLRQGETILSEFYVGKMSSTYTGAYLSRVGEDKTYLLNAPLSGLVKGIDWHDNKIFSSDQAQINKLRFQYPNQEFTVEKQADAWVGIAPYKFSVSEEKINNILALMANMSAAKIPEQNFAGTGLEKSGIIVQASGEGIDNTLMIGGAYVGEEGAGEEYFYAKKAVSDNIYLITKNDRDALNKSIRDLR